MDLNETGRTELHIACSEGDASRVESLLTAGASLDTPGPANWTPLHIACMEHNAECVKVLLDAGANVTTVDCCGRTPLHYACNSRDCDDECARLMIHAGASVDARDAVDWTPLHNASAAGNPSCVTFLLNAGADTCLKTDHGIRAIDLARQNGDAACVTVLEEGRVGV